MTSLSRPKASVLRRSVSNEGRSRLEKATFRPRSYCKSLIEVLEKCVRLFGTYFNLQFAVQLANLLTFDEEPLGIQHSNLYVRERNMLFKFTFILKSFLSRTMLWRVTFEVLGNVHAATFKFRNRVVCLSRKSTFINEATN